MVPKDTPKTAPCSLAQPKKILRDFMVSGEVSEPDTCRITISRLNGKSTPRLLPRIPELVGWVKPAVVLLLTSGLANGPNSRLPCFQKVIFPAPLLPQPHQRWGPAYSSPHFTCIRPYCFGLFTYPAPPQVVVPVWSPLSPHASQVVSLQMSGRLLCGRPWDPPQR